MDTIHNIFFFIIAIGVLVTFHEFGHYWVARKLNVKVLKFSIGFGRPLYRWVSKRGGDSVEFIIAAIPLGGYVKMLDEREGIVDEKDKSRAFNNQAIEKRTAIVAAGPVFNFILAVLLFWFVYVMGITATKPLINAPEAESIAAAANFKERDIILNVGDVVIQTWQEFRLAIINQGLDGDILVIRVRESNGLEVVRNLNLNGMHILEDDKDVVEKLGFKQWWPVLLPTIGGVIEGGEAKKSGLVKGDLIKSINTMPMGSWQQVVDLVKRSPGKALLFEIERDNQLRQITIIPAMREINGVMAGIGESELP